MIAGETVRAAARRCGVHKNTSFRWRHRFLAKLSGAKPAHLHGIVEADETYFLESFKGRRNLPRSVRKRGGKAAKRGLSDEHPLCQDRSRLPLADLWGTGGLIELGLVGRRGCAGKEPVGRLDSGHWQGRKVAG